MNECWLCMGACDPTYHASVRRIRQWLLSRDSVVPVPPPVIVSQPRRFVSGMGDIHALQSPASKRKAARTFGSLELRTPEERKRAGRLGGRGGRGR